METGYLLIFLTGLVWSAVGAVGSRAAGKNSLFTFLFTGNCAYMLWIFLTAPPLCAPLKTAASVSLVMFLSGCMGQLAFFLLYRAMKYGSASIAWSITQSALIIPLAGSFLFRRTLPGFGTIAGAALICSGIFLSGEKKGDDRGRKKTLYLSVLAFFLAGGQQMLSLVPSYLPGIPKTALSWRIPAASLSGLIFLIPMLSGKEKFNVRLLPLSLVYGAVVALGQRLCFASIDWMGLCGQEGIVYPLAVGCSIVLFQLYCILFRKERLRPWEYAGIAAICAGMIFLAFVR